MKNLFLLLFASIFTLSISAQEAATSASSSGYVNPSSWLFGGVFSVTGTGGKYQDSSGSIDNPKQSNLAIVPQAAYVLNRMLALGLALGYVNSATKTFEDIDDQSYTLKDSRGEFVIQPQLAYYVLSMSRLYIFATLYVGFGFGNATNQYLEFNDETFEYDVLSEKSSLSSIQAGIRFSFMYFLSAQWAIMLSYGDLYYRTSTQKHPTNDDEKWTDTSYGLDLTLTSLQIGIFYYLASKKAK